MRKAGSSRWISTLPVLVLLAAGATSLAASAPRVVQIKGTDAMQYDRKSIEAKPGELLTVKLTAVSSMAKAEMSHNFVLLAPGVKPDSFAMAAAMARDNGYIPRAREKEILAATALAGGGETVEVTFTAPREPGEYVYICTFPGHFTGGMKGRLIVR